jgi:cyclopropane-fatty-acyl-phospholipid synthase
MHPISVSQPRTKPETNFAALPRASRAAAALEDILAKADIRLDGQQPWDIQVHDARFYARVLAEGTLGFGESYVDGWWNCEALDEMLFRAIRARLADRFRLNLRTAISMVEAVALNLQTKRRSNRVGRQHYDLGNDFFQAMLDPSMQYSCAYFQETSDLAEAQQRKMELICRKLGLQPGMRLLDIGCGWGGLAKYAAQHHGCRVVGITISREQHAFASAACEGLRIFRSSGECRYDGTRRSQKLLHLHGNHFPLS